MPEKPIVLIEDDGIIAELIEFNLRNEGFATEHYSSFEQLQPELHRLDQAGVALFVLDIMLPGLDGFQICERLRSMPGFELTPILMLTARSTENDKVRGIEIGADDYLTKPFGIRELISRIRGLIRRYAKISENRDAAPEAVAARDVLRAGPLTLDDARHRVFVDDDEVELTNREYELLKFFLQNRGTAFSRDDLLNRVWGFDYVGETRTVDVHIRQLRRKLDLDGRNPELIETVRGRGYRFNENVK